MSQDLSSRQRNTRKVIQRRRRRITVALLLSITYIFTAIVVSGPNASFSPQDPVFQISQAAQVAWPEEGKSAFYLEGLTDIVSGTTSETPQPMASLTKLITALVLLEYHPLAENEQGESYTFTQKDHDLLEQTILDDGSWAPVTVGASLTQRSMVEGMLLPSGNNYAIMLVNWKFGSEEKYLDAADQWLKDKHLNSTTVISPEGLEPQNSSTPSDLIRIGQYVLASEVLSSIVSKSDGNFPGVGEIKNTNRLLGKYGIDGIKTGTTDEAGRCMLFSTLLTVGSQKVRMLGVVMGQSDRGTLESKVIQLLSSVSSSIHEVPLVESGQYFGEYTTVWGEASQIVASNKATMLVWSDTSVQVETSAKNLSSGDQGQEVGQVVFTSGQKTVTVPLKLDADVSSPAFGWKLLRPLQWRL